uniref:Uncharacterized protein n=1 Tax=Paramormyrops kingsleyae TaxID=1676925 RepID=A0A3B3SC45_9TELE
EGSLCRSQVSTLTDEYASHSPRWGVLIRTCSVLLKDSYDKLFNGKVKKFLKDELPSGTEKISPGEVNAPSLKGKLLDIKTPEQDNTACLSSPDVMCSVPNVDFPSISMKNENPDLTVNSLAPDATVHLTKPRVNGSKVTMPTVGVPEPKLRGLSLDRTNGSPEAIPTFPNLNGKDVNLQLPNRKVDLSGPNIDTKSPNANMNLTASEVDRGGLQYKAPKFKMPQFNLPEIKPKTSDMHIRLPDVKGDMDLSVPDPKMPNFKKPKFGFSGPNVKGPEIDADLNAPDLNLSAPKIEGKLNTPDIDAKLPKAKFSSPDIDLNSPDLDIDAPSGKFKMPNFKKPKFGKLNTPDIDAKLPKAKLSSPDLDLKSPDLNTDVPSAKINLPNFKKPKFDFSGPKVKGPEIDADLNAPDLNLSAPKIEGKLNTPDIDAKLPKAKLSSPDLDLKSPDLNTDVPSAKINLPNFKKPKFDFSGPKVKGPEIDADLNAPDLNVSAPKIEGKLNTPDIDANLPKKPKFGFSGPNVKGPEIDTDLNTPHLNLSAPKIEGNLNTPNIDMNLPKADLTGSDLHLTSPYLHIDAPSGQLKSINSPNADIDSPKFSMKDPDIAGELKIPAAKTPTFGISGSKVTDSDLNIKSSLNKPDFTVPTIRGELNPPEIVNLQKSNLKGTELGLHAPKYDTDVPSGIVKVPNLKMPNIGLSGPAVKVQDSDLYRSMETPDFSVSVPRVISKQKSHESNADLTKDYLKSPELGINIDMPTSDISLEHSETEITEALPELEVPVFKFHRFSRNVNAPTGNSEVS